MSLKTVLELEYEQAIKKFNESHPDSTDHIYWRGRLEEVKSIMNQV